jgi:hypothetical protein
VITLRQHIPPFITGYEPRVAKGTQDEVLDADFVRIHVASVGFQRLSKCDNKLMAEYSDGGRHGEWWVVVGFFDGGSLDLPEWKHPDGGRA